MLRYSQIQFLYTGHSERRRESAHSKIDMNKLFIIFLTFIMVLNLAACSTKSGSSDNVPEKPAASEQTVTQKSEPEESPVQESVADVSEETEVVDSGEPASQEPEDEVDPLSAKFNGLWITASSIGTLYYFDNGEVTTYSTVNYDPSAADLRYTIVQKQHYEVEEVTSQDGSGHKAVLENGSEYWLLDEYPNQLSLFWYDEDGELQYSGSDSLGRVTDFTVDDLILEDAK